LAVLFLPYPHGEAAGVGGHGLRTSKRRLGIRLEQHRLSHAPQPHQQKTFLGAQRPHPLDRDMSLFQKFLPFHQSYRWSPRTREKWIQNNIHLPNMKRLAMGLITWQIAVTSNPGHELKAWKRRNYPEAIFLRNLVLIPRSVAASAIFLSAVINFEEPISKEVAI